MEDQEEVHQEEVHQEEVHQEEAHQEEAHRRDHSAHQEEALQYRFPPLQLSGVGEATNWWETHH
jgi:hypothetical protein